MYRPVHSSFPPRNGLHPEKYYSNVLKNNAAGIITRPVRGNIKLREEEEKKNDLMGARTPFLPFFRLHFMSWKELILLSPKSSGSNAICIQRRKKEELWKCRMNTNIYRACFCGAFKRYAVVTRALQKHFTMTASSRSCARASF